jgi:hypothetical protein
MTNQFIPFANSSTANVLNPAVYAALPSSTTGYLAGELLSAHLNTPLRQSTMMTSAVGDFIVAQTGAAVLDDGDKSTLVASFTAAVAAAGSGGGVIANMANTTANAANATANANTLAITAETIRATAAETQLLVDFNLVTVTAGVANANAAAAVTTANAASTGLATEILRATAAEADKVSYTVTAPQSTAGDLLIGTTMDVATPVNGISLRNTTGTAGNIGIGHSVGTANAVPYITFAYGGTAVGSISQSTTSTVSYATSSDYRLKTNVQPMTGALDRVAKLKPVTYAWLSDGSRGEGFVAHELAEVCPLAVIGTKDALNKDGTPLHQSIDTSHMVGLLTAAMQELKANFDAYKLSHT